MRIILLGAPGSGKGTQARKLVETYKVPQISTGDILRAAVSEGSEAGRRAEQLMREGQLVPDDLVIEMVSQRVLKADTRRGFILDGFPRNIPQAQELDTRLGWVSRPIQIAVNFEVDESSLVKRLTGRRTCENCGAIYNIHFNAPKTRGRCDECGAHLVKRDDDNEETIRERLDVYHQETELLVQYYRAQHKLRTLNATGDTDDIFKRLCEMIDTEIRPLENKVISVHGSEGSATHTQIVGGKIVREVAGTEMRTTRVQPRQSGETDESHGADRANTSRGTAAPGKPADATAKGSDKSAPRSSKRAKKAVPTGKAAAGGKASPKPGTKKAAASETAVSKTAAAGSSARKAAAKKSNAGKTTARKTTAKSVARKSATKKSSARKAVSKKKIAKKSSARKSAAGKKAAKKSAAKKTARKAAARKSAVNKASATKKTAGKKVARKPAARKTTVAKKAAVRKKTASRKKAGSKKKAATSKKTATNTVRKTAAGKTAGAKKSSRTAARKSATRKKSGRRGGATRR